MLLTFLPRKFSVVGAVLRLGHVQLHSCPHPLAASSTFTPRSDKWNVSRCCPVAHGGVARGRAQITPAENCWFGCLKTVLYSRFHFFVWHVKCAGGQHPKQPFFGLRSPPPFGWAAFLGLSKFSFLLPRLYRRFCHSPSGSSSHTSAISFRILPIKGQALHSCWQSYMTFCSTSSNCSLIRFSSSLWKTILSITVGLPVIPGMYQQLSSSKYLEENPPKKLTSK